MPKLCRLVSSAPASSYRPAQSPSRPPHSLGSILSPSPIRTRIPPLSSQFPFTRPPSVVTLSASHHMGLPQAIPGHTLPKMLGFLPRCDCKRHVEPKISRLTLRHLLPRFYRPSISLVSRRPLVAYPLRVSYPFSPVFVRGTPCSIHPGWSGNFVCAGT